MKYRYITLSIGLLLLHAGSCTRETENVDKNQKPIVSLRGKVLYAAQLNEIIPYGTSQQDSTILADKYIEVWINDILMYDKAKQNIMDEEEINELVNEYRESLIVNTYQSQILREMLSKKITDNELKMYYDENPGQFKLKENIIKGLYLKVPVNSPQLSNFLKWYKMDNDKGVENIEKNNLQNAVSYDYFYNKWVSLDDVLENIPLNIPDEEQYLRLNKNIEVKDDKFAYLLNIKEFKLKGTLAPYDYIKEQMTEIFLEKKRNEYLQQIQKDLYDKAISNNEIKFYNK